ncbi:MAG TPA: DUF11 domain-containing protein [bacterium]|nr:DUF11 domain-containing protein [bacterium]
MKRTWLAAALLIALWTALPAGVSAGGNLHNKIAVHLVPHGTGCPTLPSFSTCSDIHTTYSGPGDIDVIPVFFDLNAYTLVEFGLAWPAQWGSIDYVRCVGDISIGAIVHPGDGIATAWSECQTTWSVAHGYGWLAPTGAGQITIVRDPPTGDYGVVDCAPEDYRAYDYPAAVFNAGVGGVPGDDPCQQVLVRLDLAKTDNRAGKCVVQGDTLTYTITYANTLNTADVHNVVLIDSLPDDATFVTASDMGAYDGAYSRVTWDIGTVGAGTQGTRSVTVVALAPAVSTMSNMCRITSSETPANTASCKTAICAGQHVPITIIKADGTSGTCSYQGDVLTYSINFRNPTNAATAYNVILTDYLPAGVEFVSASGGGTYDPANATVTWIIGTLVPGQSGTRQVVATLTAPLGTIVTNTCQIGGYGTPYSGATKSTSVCAHSLRPLHIAKTTDLGSGCATYGTNLTYSISYNNSANSSEVHNVILTDDLPGQTDFVSASSGGSYDAGAHRVTWNLGTLAASASGTQQVTVKVNVAQGATFTNTCAVTGDETGPSQASRSVTVCGGSSRNQNHKIAVHVKAHPTSCTKGYPAFTSCSQIQTTYAQSGDLDALPVFYDLTEYTLTEFGLEWPAAWGSCSFTRCKGDLAIGGIVHSGEGIAIAWTACQYGWAVAPGYAWLTATGAGRIGICPNPATGDFGVVNCAPEPGPYYDRPVAVSGAGVGGVPGDDPCPLTPPHVEGTTWGAIKAMFK